MEFNSSKYSIAGAAFAFLLVLIAHHPMWALHGHIFFLIALAALIAWIIFHRRYRSVADTPTARIASAPQGYVEIAGLGRPLDGTPLYSPLNGLPCLWYRIHVERKNYKGQWEHDYSDTSDASFILDDGSGRCVVDPEHANIISTMKDTVVDSGTRTTQWLLVAGTRIYALGHFVTHNAIAELPAISADVRDKLASWKETGEAKRFDLNNDGELSAQEWELARAAAKREVEKEHSSANTVPDLNMLTRPPDGRTFVISNMPAEKLIRHYRWLAWGCLLIFFGALASAAWLHITFQ